jgi:hypothetical protein
LDQPPSISVDSLQEKETVVPAKERLEALDIPFSLDRFPPTPSTQSMNEADLAFRMNTDVFLLPPPVVVMASVTGSQSHAAAAGASERVITVRSMESGHRRLQIHPIAEASKSEPASPVSSCSHGCLSCFV